MEQELWLWELCEGCNLNKCEIDEHRCEICDWNSKEIAGGKWCDSCRRDFKESDER